ncbi:MAG: hypothetical protein ABIP88_04660 [Candidatus Binatia bacterium]
MSVTNMPGGQREIADNHVPSKQIGGRDGGKLKIFLSTSFVSMPYEQAGEIGLPDQFVLIGAS